MAVHQRAEIAPSELVVDEQVGARTYYNHGTRNTADTGLSHDNPCFHVFLSPPIKKEREGERGHADHHGAHGNEIIKNCANVPAAG